MLLNPIIAILKNEKLNRWHPIIFDESPLPGPDSEDKPIRHQSKGHHTNGFKRRDLAIKEVRSIVERMVTENKANKPGYAIEEDILWDGVGIPAITGFFIRTEQGWKLAVF